MAKLTAQDKKWQAESDLSTIRRAEEVRQSSSRLRAAQALAKKEMKALARLAKSTPRKK